MDPGVDVIKVVNPAPTDQHGEPTGPPVEVDVEGCSLQPRTSAEDDDRGVTVISGAVLFTPPGAPITALSRIEFDGTTYEVQGDPAAWRDQGGDAHHVQAQLRRVTG